MRGGRAGGKGTRRLWDIQPSWNPSSLFSKGLCEENQSIAWLLKPGGRLQSERKMGLVASLSPHLRMLLGHRVPWRDGRSPHGRAGRQGRTEAAHGVVQMVRRGLRDIGGTMGRQGLSAARLSWADAMPSATTNCRVTAGSKLGIPRRDATGTEDHNAGGNPCLRHSCLALAFQTVLCPCNVSEGRGI